MVPKIKTMSSTSRRIAIATATVSSQPANSGGGGGGGVDGTRRQCWECQRRRVVCDSARPVCDKCKAAGVVCPGYEDKKPLVWLAPGKVKTRTWKRKPASSNKMVSSKKPSNGSEGHDNSVIAAASGSTQLVHIFPGTELRTQTCDIIEATMYWNDQVYPSFAKNQLAFSPWVVPVTYIQYLPAAIQHALVAMAIDHRMLRMARKKNDPYVAEVRSRFHQHRCTAIQSLNEKVNNDLTRSADATMASVLTFLYADLMGSATAHNWRFHLSGLAAMMEMRNGFRALSLVPHLKPILLFVKIIETLSNTTSPANDQVRPTESYELIDVISDLYETGYYPYFPCPVPLFTDIIRVNRIRHVAATDVYAADISSTQAAAEETLERVIEFSPDAWSETKDESPQEFLQMAQVYQSSVVLFGISSMQSIGALPFAAGWKAVKTIHHGRLLALLEKAVQVPSLRNCLSWPLIVAGFEAAVGSPDKRAFVSRRLAEQAQELGIYLPLAAKELLEVYWASGRIGWDECFDKPHALVA